ncbi:MAG: hypothetical protein H0X17_03935 [Deltaproteobacteria bacterium]|nr:hypothetical protein [Deltaproteobacteria bacterium]
MKQLVRLVPLLFALDVLAGCGGDADDPRDTGLCADRPCRTSITTADDWGAVSAAHTGARCDFGEDTKYLAPATTAAALQEVVFHDVKTHRLHVDFMTQVLTEYFGGLPQQMYQELVQRRATRQYWAGAVFRIHDATGVVIGYGFDVIVDPTAPDERLTEDEILRIETLLETRFALPLVYAPTTRDAIEDSSAFTRVIPHLPRACNVVACEDPAKDCIQIPSAVSLCGQFMEGRTVAVEYARKARLAAVPGTYELPRAVGTHTVPALFGTGELGPSRLAITPTAGSARYEVSTSNGYTSRRYRQAFRAGTQSLQLEWSVALPEAGGGFQLAEPHVQGRVQAIAAIDGSQDYNDLVMLSSCAATSLDAFRVRGTLPAGDGFTIELRHQVPMAGSGPLFVTRGEVTLGGQTAVVSDYFNLVYAGEHHNWNNQYWVLFDAPLTYAGHPVYGLWLDQEEYGPTLEAAWTLGANRQPLDALTVSNYRMELVP